MKNWETTNARTVISIQRIHLQIKNAIDFQYYKVHARVPRRPWLKAIHGIWAIRLIPTNCRAKFHRPRILCAVKMFFMDFDAFYREPRGTFSPILIILNSKLPGGLSAR